jgi:hypothetical protein
MTRLLRFGGAYKCGQQHQLGGRNLSAHPTTEASNGTASLIRVRPEKSERRFYVLAVDVDLFGCVLLVRHWGRLGTSGRMSGKRLRWLKCCTPVW